MRAALDASTACLGRIEIEDVVVAETMKLDRQDSSILARAFRGELVPQDPSDEPASALLERIRAERASAPAKGRKS